MERSSSGSKKPFFKSNSPSNSLSNNIAVQPEVLQALNAKVLKIQKSCQNLVKICIPNMQEGKAAQRNSPLKREILNISPADFNKVTPRITARSKNLPSPLITPRADFPSSKIDLKIENRSPAILKQSKPSESPMKQNKKTRSQYHHLIESFNTDLNKSNIEKLKVKKLFKISKDFLKNILKLCNTCPESSKISGLVAESCESFKKSLENIEKEEKFVSFYDEHPVVGKSESTRARQSSEFLIIKKIEEIDQLKMKNEELECEIMKTKHMIMLFSEERSEKENDLLVHIVKKLNKFSHHLNSINKKTRDSFEVKPKTVFDQKEAQISSPKSSKINSLEYHLLESKRKIFELENSVKQLNSYKSEHFSLVSELAKTSETLETLRRTCKLKEIECKQKDANIEKLSEENKKTSNENIALLTELSEKNQLLEKLKEYQERNNLESNHKILEEEKKKILEKLMEAEEKLKTLEENESQKKLIEDILIELKQVKLEKSKLEDSLQDFYKVLKEKLLLEEKLQDFEEISTKKQELEDKVKLLDDELQISKKTIENFESQVNQKKLNNRESDSSKFCECFEELKILRNDNQQLKDKYLRVSKENESSLKTIQDLEKAVRDSSQLNLEISSLKQQLLLKTAELEETKKAFKEAKSQKGLKSSKEKTDFLEQSLTKLKTLEQENISLMHENSEKSSVISSLESKLNEMKSLNSSSTNLESCEILIESSKAELMFLKSELTKSKESCNSLGENVQFILSKLGELDSAQSTMSSMLEMLKSTNETLADENRLHIISKTALLSKNSELENDVKSITDKLLKKSHEISSLEDTLFSLSNGDKAVFSVNFDELHQTKLALTETRAKLEETQKDLALTGVKFTFLKDQVNQLKSQNEGLHEKNQKLDRLLREKSSERKIMHSKTVVYADEADEFRREELKLRASTTIPDRKSILKKPSNEDQRFPSGLVFLEASEKLECFFTEDSPPPMKSVRMSEQEPFKGK